MKSLLYLIILVISSGCAHQHTVTILDNEHPSDMMHHALVDTELDRYVIFRDDEVVIDEEGAEDIRAISVTYDRWAEGHVVIRTSKQPQSEIRSKQVIQILKGFGVDDNDIEVREIRDELAMFDNVIQISLDINVSDLGYVRSP